MQCLFLKGKLKTKQNPSLSGSGYWVYRRTRWPRVGATRGGRPQLGLKARHDTRAIGPKEVAQHLSRFWTSTCFKNCRWLQTDMDLNLAALERLWNYISNHIKFSSNGLRMWPWRYFGADYFWNPRRKWSPSWRRVGLKHVRIWCSDVLIIQNFVTFLL